MSTMIKWALCLLVCAGCAVQGELSFSAALVDFGHVLPGSEQRDSIVLTNKGNASQVIAGWSSTNPNFAVDFPERLTLSPQESRTLSVRHVPPNDATEPELADLRVWSDEGLAAAFHARSLPTEPEVINLSMRDDVAMAASFYEPRIPVPDDCTLPASLDFGALFSGESKTLELSLRNSALRRAAPGSSSRAPATSSRRTRGRIYCLREPRGAFRSRSRPST